MRTRFTNLFWLAGLYAAAGLTAFGGDGRTELSQSMMPITLSQPGSYVLTEDLAGPADSVGISITADDVTLDLNGFALVGNDSGAPRDGILASGQRWNIAIRNGVIRNWRRDGLDLASASNSVLSALQIEDCAHHGIIVGGASMVIDCELRNNGLDGIDAAEGCVLARIASRSNGGDGIDAESFSLVVDATTRENDTQGIESGSGGAVLDSTARGSGGVGIDVETAALVAGCASYGNGGHGVNARQGSLVSACTVYNNTGYGITVDAASLVIRNTASRNSTGGILASDLSYIVENQVADHSTGSGIVAQGERSWIDSNHLARNNVGIEVTGDDTVITRNTSADDGTAYAIGSGNHYEVDATDFNVPKKPWVNFSF
jgi:hypothetical protein